MFFTRKRLHLYLVALLTLQIFLLFAGIPVARDRYIDFRTFYTAGAMLRMGHGSQLYNYAVEKLFQDALVKPNPSALPMMSPPPTALLFVPLSYFGFWAAYFIFAAANILVLLASVLLLKSSFPALSSRWSAAPYLLFFSFLPAGYALFTGQLSIILLLLYSVCFVLLRRGDDRLAGFVLAVTLAKFQIALPVAILFLLWRRWSFIVGFFTGTLCFTALSIWIVGPFAFVSYLHSLYSMTRAVTADPYVQRLYAIVPREMPNLYGILFHLVRGTAWGHIIVITASVAIFIWATLQRPSFPLALITAMLVSYHLFAYDLTLLLLPLSLLANQFLGKPNPPTASAQCPDIRLRVSRISLVTLLFGPLLRLLIASDEVYWLAIPILALLLSADVWPPLRGVSGDQLSR